MRKIGLVIVLVVTLLTGCKSTATFQSHGYEVITVDADGDQIAEAISITHQTMGNWVESPNGSKTDSSFSQSGRYWKDKQGRIEAARGQTKFCSKDGIELRLLFNLNHCNSFGWKIQFNSACF